MRTPEQELESMEIQMERGIDQNASQRQIHATLILAEQVKRIADALDNITFEAENGSRALAVIRAVIN